MTTEHIAAEITWVRDRLDRLLKKVLDIEADLHNRARAGEAEAHRQDEQHTREDLVARVTKLEDADLARSIIVEALSLWITTESQRELAADRAERLLKAEKILHTLEGRIN